MTFLMIYVNKDLHDCFAARGMRLVCLTQTGCESASLGVGAEGIAVAGTWSRDRRGRLRLLLLLLYCQHILLFSEQDAQL